MPGTSPETYMVPSYRTPELRAERINLEAEKQWFASYVSNRRARGIDPEGIPVEELDKRHA
jgi:hypothetical protein